MVTRKTTSRASVSKSEMEQQYDEVVQAHSSSGELDPKAAEVAKRNAEVIKKATRV